MNIKLIDQVLNAAIASLIYGSEIWFMGAFSLYVVGRSKKAEISEMNIELNKQETGDTPIAVIPPAEVEPVAIEPFEKAVAKPVKVAEDKPAFQAIACEPVNWKKWKVGDLRKANIAKVCSVKTRPIGSRRTLTKADLIAQYEQNLKRLTKSPPKQTINQNMTA